MKRQVLFVSIIVLVSALASGCLARREREATLKQDLRVMRQAIDQYTLDKQKPPQSLQDLMDGII
jgi:general secretion pathway protein G